MEDLLFFIKKRARTESGYLTLALERADGLPLPDIQPGAFAEVVVPREAGVLLRRPISIHLVEPEAHTVWLMVREVGAGTRALSALTEGSTLQMLLPLGKGFRLDFTQGDTVVLLGGGVGAAPLLEYGRRLTEQGVAVHFILGARTASELPPADAFARFGTLHLMTDDGTAGTAGRVTEHPLLQELPTRTAFAACGPRPMLTAVARKAEEVGVPCEVSLENRMACGLGACLCCVETMADGHNLCVCTEGPVFDSRRWLADK